MEFRGFLQVYTGNGKGKTTAAVGLSIRAIGAGLKVAFFQFFKPGDSSEVHILKSFDSEVLYKNFGSKGFVKGNVTEELKNLVIKGWEEAKQTILSRKYQLVILDEFTYALNWDICSLDEVLDFLKTKPKDVEVVITGRNAPEKLIDVANLVTLMKKVKHYFDEKIPARKGIEK